MVKKLIYNDLIPCTPSPSRRRGAGDEVIRVNSPLVYGGIWVKGLQY